MAKRSGGVLLSAVNIDRRSSPPLYRQLYEELRGAVLSGRLAPGARLPSTRTLAAELGLSRTTVVNTFEQLTAEGYLVGRVGAGTYTTTMLPETASREPPDRSHGQVEPCGLAGGLSARGRCLAATRAGSRPSLPRAFVPGVPALDEFPFKTWARLAGRYWRKPEGGLLRYGDRGGYPPLRKAIASYLGDARGVTCEPEQVVVVSGAQQAFLMIALALLDPGDAVWVEDPGHLAARDAFLAAGATVVPVPIDAQGIDLDAGIARRSDARLVYATPSRQHPLGVTMSLARRLEILDWANRSKAWVVEDDYDSEFRYSGRPMAAMQGLDRTGCVLYIGTFSKVMYPSLRLGYVVVPPNLVDAFCAIRMLVDHTTSTIPQAMLTDFINEGFFSAHIRRMRSIYAERQEVLVEVGRRELAGLLDVAPSDSGMHLIGWLPDGIDDGAASRAAAARGVDVFPLSFYCAEPYPRQGLLLGFAGTDPGETSTALQKLAAALAEVAAGIA